MSGLFSSIESTSSLGFAPWERECRNGKAIPAAAHWKSQVTCIINNELSNRIIKEGLVSMRSTAKFTGMDMRDPEIDFVHLGQSFGLATRRVTDPQDIAPALREAFASGKPNLVDIRVADGFGD